MSAVSRIKSPVGGGGKKGDLQKRLHSDLSFEMMFLKVGQVGMEGGKETAFKNLTTEEETQYRGGVVKRLIRTRE